MDDKFEEPPKLQEGQYTIHRFIRNSFLEKHNQQLQSQSSTVEHHFEPRVRGRSRSRERGAKPTPPDVEMMATSDPKPPDDGAPPIIITSTNKEGPKTRKIMHIQSLTQQLHKHLKQLNYSTNIVTM